MIKGTSTGSPLYGKLSGTRQTGQNCLCFKQHQEDITLTSIDVIQCPETTISHVLSILTLTSLGSLLFQPVIYK